MNHPEFLGEEEKPHCGDRFLPPALAGRKNSANLYKLQSSGTLIIKIIAAALQLLVY